MKLVLKHDHNYIKWLSDVKSKVQQAQLKAAVKVNTELLMLYWELGAGIVAKQAQTKWGEGFLSQLSNDLMAEFPDMKGFSKRNLELIRQWYLFYSKGDTLFGQLGQQTVTLIAKQPVSQLPNDQISQQPVSLITQIPWGHNIVIMAKCKSVKEAFYYVQNTVNHNWSRSVLIHQIESRLYKREGKSVNNFALTLPKPQSDLAMQTLKDPYIFDFLSMTKDYNERDLENALISHITKFLLELGAGFSYLGKQVPLKISDREFFIDLLFYHVKLHCFVVIELKTVDFEPEHAGKMNFYLKAVDSQLRSKEDVPTIGILICKKKDKLIAEYALSDIKKPIGISEYRLTQSLPKRFKSSLPTIKEIEAELSGDVGIKKK